MKKYLFLVLIATATAVSAQSDLPPCKELPIARPDVKAVCETADLVKYFETRIPEKLKKGTHSGVYKLFVDCNGITTTVAYQRGTLTEADQLAFKEQIKPLTWKPATHQQKTVTSVVFITLEIVNGKFTVVVQ